MGPHIEHEAPFRAFSCSPDSSNGTGAFEARFCARVVDLRRNSRATLQLQITTLQLSCGATLQLYNSATLQLCNSTTHFPTCSATLQLVATQLQVKSDLYCTDLPATPQAEPIELRCAAWKGHKECASHMSCHRTAESSLTQCGICLQDSYMSTRSTIMKNEKKKRIKARD